MAPVPAEGLHLSNLSVPRIIDVAQKAKLFCSYAMGNRTLNSVKWYKDGQEFFRYSPLTPPTTNWFPVAGVTIADGSPHCNQFICNVELEKLSAHSSGQYRCEVSGDAPEFKLIDQTANMTVGGRCTSDPVPLAIHSGPVYFAAQSKKFLCKSTTTNCTSEMSSPMAKLMWFINNKTLAISISVSVCFRPQAPVHSLQPQINEVARNTDGFHLFTSHLQLRLHLDDQRFISKSEMLELRCTADIMGLAAVRRQQQVRTTILALKDAGTKQRLTENGSCITGQPASLAAWLLSLVHILRWHGSQS
ncbi:hypothetical protein M5D96_000767 [Drosophila gunungcola]|uniref:Ig-like domain-containing protein n=1 Tax=Drosophila gunungcola TaxID=103775 RepID=A0A9P9YWY7_9MUSC|nr:hypothetical protein M5D96_000767 [Drosophila gunungcola]